MTSSPSERSYAEAECATECTTMARRGTAGGLYYVAGWLVVCVEADVYGRHPLVIAAIGAAFAALAIARLALAYGRPLGQMQQERHLRRWWCVIFATLTLWSGVSTWCYVDDDFESARVVVLLCSMAFATAAIFVYAVRGRRAFAGAAAQLVPSLAWTFAEAETGVAIMLSLFSIYLVGALFANYADHCEQRAQRRELAAQRDRYVGLAHTDVLTSLPNRRVFTWTLEQMFASESAASLLIVDIDHFKRINDTYGHAAGDACLVAFAEILRDSVAGCDAVVARLGGEEFGIVLQGIPLPTANGLALAIRGRLHASANDPTLCNVTASIGVGDRRAEYRRPEEWFVDVDRALYRAKHNGRDRVCSV
ncbi:GGDEF domain-containing protein [Tahibacter soli]|jgi:diguanylate cyclase (GGDEF)-like protein|uniref:diguanylate cyclase n=1 Tax=Tahibacter soli TaxID=2983605 RepID=A0A9X4BFI7_9GAMM|nr:GGDEF domain-containing protein [Tahibacter soli]MDC8011175.1 GGDEF domain-containing protein [Tahibacter soli]